MDLKLGGSRVLITGASKGIGAAAAEVFAEEGCDLLLAARNLDALDALAERLRQEHEVDVRTQKADLRQAEDIYALAKTDPGLDVLVNNAGDIPAGTLAEIDDPMWRHAWDLKVYGYINLTRLVYARMGRRGKGVIINNIGASGGRVDPGYVAGSVGNAALVALTRALGSGSLADGIRVVGVNPGPVETERAVTLNRALAKQRLGDESRYRELLSDLPLGRPARPREIADTIAFLASPRSAYTSGTVLTIDGGRGQSPP